MEYGRSPAGWNLARVGGLVRRHPDFILCLSITLLAAVVRLWDLGSIPSGIHGDEAQVGLDAKRVLHSGWIGPYTWSALGQPSGHAYLTAPAIALFGSNAWALRLPLALTGIAAVPLAYILFRQWSSRTHAALAATLLAVSLWHLHFSRIAHWPISYPTVELAVLILWTQAMRNDGRRWFITAGAMLGLGLYTYNVYPMFVIAFVIWVLAYTFIYKRGPRLRQWVSNVALAAGVSILVALPLFIFILTHTHEYFDHYEQYVDQYSVLRSFRFEHGTLLEKAEVLKDQIVRYAGAYIWHGLDDNVDGAGVNGQPIIDPTTLVLFAVGLGSTLLHWRRPANLLCLSLLFVLPLAGVLQTNATYRGTLGLAPMVCFIAAIPLTTAWREVGALDGWLRLVPRAALLFALAVIAVFNLYAYFSTWANSDNFDKVYARDFTDAVQYVDGLRNRPYVYLYSNSFRMDHETRQFIAPKLQGDERSAEFRGARDVDDLNRNHDAVALMLDSYTRDDTLQALRQRYPGGETYTAFRDGKIAFEVYTLPAPIRLNPP